MKLDSRDILALLRQFKIASSENVPRHVSLIKKYHPSTHNSLYGFNFLSKQLFLLFDEFVEDDQEAIIGELRKLRPELDIKLIPNPLDENTYGLPYQGKTVYLLQVGLDKQRLDSELSRRYTDISRNTWQKYIKAGRVCIDGKIVNQPDYYIGSNSDIVINWPEATDYSRYELPVIYRDDNVIVINKPAGLLTHAKGELNDEFTVAEYFKRFSTFHGETNRPGIVHRLDRDTSGVLIGALNEPTGLLLQKQFSQRCTKKTYIAIVVGRPKHDKARIDLPILRNPLKPSTFRVDSGGKSATTDYEVLATNGKYSLIRLRPYTGRTHQLRVHLKYIGTPILGDRLYGKTAKRLFLHALSLEITIPESQRRVFEAPLPDEFKKYFPDIEL